jgi:small GTP-binding protein
MPVRASSSLSHPIIRFHPVKTGHFMNRVVLIGDPSVGKTSLIARVVKDEFNPSTIRQTTSFACFPYRSAQPDDPEIEIWDTAGMEKYRSLNNQYYRDACGAIIVFDLTKPSTFQNARELWTNDFKTYASPNSFIILVGNKLDLQNEIRVTEEGARFWANENDINYFQTSALSGQGVSEMMSAVLKLVPKDRTAAVTVDLIPPEKDGCC